MVSKSINKKSEWGLNMAKISKKKREEILLNRFPEFKKLCDEMKASLQVIYDELEEKLEQIEDIQYKIDDLEEAKLNLNL